MARIPAGRGRPGPSPSAHAITAPWEKPPSTVRSIGTPVRAASPSSHDRRRSKVARKVSASALAVVLGRVPVVADRRQLQRPARERADEPLARVEDVDQRRHVLLAGAAAVQEDDRAGGLARRDPQLLDQLVDVGHEGGRYSVRERWNNNCSFCCSPSRSSASTSRRRRASCCAPPARSPSTPRGSRSARIPAPVAAGLAVGQAKRMRLPGTPAAVAIFHPLQFYLAGALLARHPTAELWYGEPEPEERARARAAPHRRGRRARR